MISAGNYFTDHLDQGVLNMRKEAKVQIDVRDILWAEPILVQNKY